jgi:hypothetical protein
MSTMASSPVDQITGSVGMSLLVKWADLIDDDVEVSAGPHVSAEVESDAGLGSRDALEVSFLLSGAGIIPYHSLSYLFAFSTDDVVGRGIRRPWAGDQSRER